MSVDRKEILLAYGLVLGRKPRLQEEKQARLRFANVRQLGLTLRRSEEFRKSKPKKRAVSTSEYGVDLSERKIIFIHIPKCGGTTLDATLRRLIQDCRPCPERFNKLQDWTVADLGGYNLFSGHFDLLSARLIPGFNNKLITMLRKPKKRIESYYYFLRSRKIKQGAGQPLVRLAHKYSFKEFLNCEELRNGITFHNTLVKVLIDRLEVDGPIRAVTEEQLHDLLVHDAELAVEIAYRNLISLDGYGILEDVDKSVNQMLRNIGLPPVDSFEKKQSLDDLVANHTQFRDVPKQEPDAELEELLDENTKLDDILYDRAVAFHAARDRRKGVSRAVEH